MKKLLAILGSVAIGASSASTVVACSNTNKKQQQNVQTNSQQALTNESLDSIKPLVMADQYGLALDKTNETISNINNYPNKQGDFASLDNSVAKGMNLNGLIGKDNAPLYPLADKLNGLLGKIGVGPIDFTPYLDNWGGVIKKIPDLINSGNIDGLLGLIPMILENTVDYIPKGLIGPKTIKKVSKFIKDNIASILKEFNLNMKIGEIVNSRTKQGKKTNLVDIEQAGADALDKLGNIFFKDYANLDGFSSRLGDDSISAFLGHEIFTPLLNGGQIDKDKLKDLFNTNILLSHIGDIVTYASTFIATVLFRLTVYMPLLADKPTDVDNLFDKSKAGDTNNVNVLKKYDAMEVDSDEVGNITIGPDKTSSKISFNNSIFGVIALLEDTDEKDFSIFKLTNILFANSNSNNGLTDYLTKILLDSFKFTDYKVSVSTSVNIGVGTIQVDISFTLNQLFEDGEIDIVKSTGAVVANLLWPHFPTAKDLKILAKVSGNGLLGNSPYIESLLEAILTGKSLSSDNLKGYVVKILGDDNDSFEVVEHASFLWGADQEAALGPTDAFGTIWKILGPKIAPVLDGILDTMWYTDGDKFFKALKGTGFMKDKKDASGNTTETVDQQIAAMKKSMDKFLPLAETVASAIKKSPIGDLSDKTNLLNIDAILNTLNILFMYNPIQPVGTPDGSQSLIEELLTTLNDDNKGSEWNRFLGYKTSDVSIDNEDPKAVYVRADGLLGQLVEALYPKVGINGATKGVITSGTENTPTVKTDEKPDNSGKNNYINLRALSTVQSAVMDALDSYMTNLAGQLQGKDLTYIIKPLLNDPNAWKISDVKNTFFKGTNDLQKQTYVLKFDSSSTNISGESTKTATYEITFSRIDKSSKFSFDRIEKVIKK